MEYCTGAYQPLKVACNYGAIEIQIDHMPPCVKYSIVLHAYVSHYYTSTISILWKLYMVFACMLELHAPYTPWLISSCGVIWSQWATADGKSVPVEEFTFPPVTN